MQCTAIQCPALKGIFANAPTSVRRSRYFSYKRKNLLRGWLQIFYSQTDASTNQDLSTYRPYSNNNQPHLENEEKINKPHISPPPARWVPQPDQFKKRVNAWSEVPLYESNLLASPSAQRIFGGNWLFWGIEDTLFFLLFFFTLMVCFSPRRIRTPQVFTSPGGTFKTQISTEGLGRMSWGGDLVFTFLLHHIQPRSWF